MTPKDHAKPTTATASSEANGATAAATVPGSGEFGIVPGVVHSPKGLAHDRMHGGVKGKRKSKKDKLREAAALAARLEKELGPHVEVDPEGAQ